MRKLILIPCMCLPLIACGSEPGKPSHSSSDAATITLGIADACGGGENVQAYTFWGHISVDYATGICKNGDVVQVDGEV